MSGFLPAGYLHVCDAVARWAELQGLPVPVPPPRTPYRSLWQPRGEDWERAKDGLRQELYAGNVPAFDFDQASGRLQRIEPRWWGGDKAGLVLDGAEGTNRGYIESYPTVLVPERGLLQRQGTDAAPPGRAATTPNGMPGRHRGFHEADVPFVERALRLMAEDASLSAWAAVLALGDELPGRGTHLSRQTRIFRTLRQKLRKLKTSRNVSKD